MDAAIIRPKNVDNEFSLRQIEPQPFPKNIEKLMLSNVFPQFEGKTSVVGRSIGESISINTLIILAGFCVLYAKSICKSPYFKSFKTENDYEGSIDRIDLILIQYINNEESWYLDLRSIKINGFCEKGVKYDHNINVQVEQSDSKLPYTSDGKNKKTRRDYVWTATISMKNASLNGTSDFKINKNYKYWDNIHHFGSFEFQFKGLNLKLTLVAQEIDHKFRKDGINFRVPEMYLEYDFDDFTFDVTKYPQEYNVNETKIKEILDDFVREKFIGNKTEITERITRHLLIAMTNDVIQMNIVQDIIGILLAAMFPDDFSYQKSEKSPNNSKWIPKVISALKELGVKSE